MNTDHPGSATRPGDEPIEARLRKALDEDARSVNPTERLDSILAEARGASFGAARPPEPGSATASGVGRPRRWLLPAAAAAAVLLVAGTVWTVNRLPSQVPPVAATSPTEALPSASPTTSASTASAIRTQTADGLSPSPTMAPTTMSPPTMSPTSEAPPATVPVTVPVYYVGPVVAGSQQLRLFREFVPAPVPAPATAQGEALAALRLAMGAPPAGSAYRSAWSGVTPQSVALSAGDITVRLSSGTTNPQQLATEQLVWTVQAALGKALPVSFQLDDGGTQVSPGHPAGSTFTRPTDPMAVLDQVAPIWVDEPARGAVVRAGAPLEVKGVASTFEATVLWEVLRDGRRVDSGVTTAAQSAPARAAYAFATRPVPAGSYVLRVYESSAENATTVAEQRVGFTAR